MFAINTREEDIPCEYASLDFEPGSGDEIEVRPNNPIIESEKRIQQLKTLIFTSHLNSEEVASVENLIEEFPHVFLLPGDALPCTDLVEHYIPTETNLPVNAKRSKLKFSLFV